jgi:hypothetical protein
MTCRPSNRIDVILRHRLHSRQYVVTRHLWLVACQLILKSHICIDYQLLNHHFRHINACGIWLDVNRCRTHFKQKYFMPKPSRKWVTTVCGDISNEYAIVWTISTCASLDRRVLEFRFQAPISLGCVPLGNLSGSNWIWPCGFLKNNLPVVSVQIR